MFIKIIFLQFQNSSIIQLINNIILFPLSELKNTIYKLHTYIFNKSCYTQMRRLNPPYSVEQKTFKLLFFLTSSNSSVLSYLITILSSDATWKNTGLYSD